MLRSLSWTGGAAIKLAHSTSTMLDADAACIRKCGAAFQLAHFRVATAMPTAPSFGYRLCCRGAISESAEPIGAVLLAETTRLNSCITPCSRTSYLFVVMRSTNPSCFGAVAATFGRTGHFVSGVLTYRPCFLGMRCPYTRTLCRSRARRAWC